MIQKLFGPVPGEVIVVEFWRLTSKRRLKPFLGRLIRLHLSIFLPACVVSVFVRCFCAVSEFWMRAKWGESRCVGGRFASKRLILTSSPSLFRSRPISRASKFRKNTSLLRHVFGCVQNTKVFIVREITDSQLKTALLLQG